MNISKTSLAAALLAAATAVTGILLPMETSAAESRFTDSSGDHDLANSANWSPTTWGSGDSLIVSTDNFTFPDAGLTLSGTMPQSTYIHFGTLPNKNVTIDFAGKNLNTAVVYLDTMHNWDNRNYYLKAIGGFSGVTRMRNINSQGHIRLYDGTYTIGKGLFLNGWVPQVHVCNGAELVIEEINTDGNVQNGFGMHGDTAQGVFCIDGGKAIIRGRTDASWTRAMWLGGTSNRNAFKVLNGGEWRDDTTMPATTFNNVNVTIKDSGYYETNSCNNVRNTGFFGNATKYEITNSTFRVAQLYTSQYTSSGEFNYELDTYKLTGSTVDFCDSEVTLAFAPGSAIQSSGVVLAHQAQNNTMKFRGDKSRFSAQLFRLGGSNTLSVAGGSFAVSNKLSIVAANGLNGSTLLIRDADAYFGEIAATATATNALIEISGTANVKGNGDFATGGPGSAMRVTDDAVLAIDAHKFSLQADGSELFLGGLASTGAVHFTAANCTATVAGTTNRTILGAGWSRLAPVWFAPGKANNVLVISNATYDCQGPAYREMVSTAEGLQNEARAFTQCPGCRIEFRGSSPEFIVSSTKTSVEAGNAWFSMAFGEMYDSAGNRYTQAYYALDNPVRLRFVLPPSTEIYAQAPIRSDNGIIVLGGNAEFEFDMSEYDWPQGRFTFPLVYNGTGFKGSSGGVTRTYIDVDKLNETNAARMPMDKYGKKAGKFELSADGKTLNFVVKNSGPTILTFR